MDFQPGIARSFIDIKQLFIQSFKQLLIKTSQLQFMSLSWRNKETFLSCSKNCNYSGAGKTELVR